jgi:hypothetical protein
MKFDFYNYLLGLVGKSLFLGILQNPKDTCQINDLFKMGLFEHLIPRKVTKGRPGNVLVAVDNMTIQQKASLGLLFDLLSKFQIGIRLARKIVSDELFIFLFDIGWLVDSRNFWERIYNKEIPCFYAKVVRTVPETVPEGVTTD